MSNAKRAILNTILYSDLFDYPLNKRELWYLLKSNIQISKKEFLTELKALDYVITSKNNYFCICSKERIIKQRINKELINKNKLCLAKKAANILSLVPTAYFIGLSGSVAQGNAKADDDIDFFVISKENTIWYTRFTILFILQLLNIRRTRNTKNENNKICVNMIIDEKSLTFNNDRKDIYTAHEIAQLKPLVDRHKTYIRFIKANSWIEKFMPNVIKSIKIESKSCNLTIIKVNKFIKLVTFILFKVIENKYIEWLLGLIQVNYINKHKTSETILNHLLAFHPHDYRIRILTEYKKKLVKFGLM